MNEYAPVDIVCARYTEREPHPGRQEAFTIRARLPWQSHPQTRVMIEMTVDEPVLRPVQMRRIIHKYGEPLDAEDQVYSLEKMAAEKLWAILQFANMLERRGSRRSGGRDYYCLWQVFGTYGEQMDLTDFPSLVHQKCAVRGVNFEGTEDFFHSRRLRYVGDTWAQWLGPLVTGLPHFEAVINGLRPQVEALVSSDDAR